MDRRFAPWLVALAAVVVACGGPTAATRLATRAPGPMTLEHDLRPLPTPAPSATSDVAAARRPVAGPATSTRLPSYPTVFRLHAPSVGIDLPVVAVGVVNGGMEAPEGPLGSPFWREAFWLGSGATPGTPGVATIAGHLDDTAGRPAAFWNLRSLGVGDVVSFTRLADGVTVRYRITEVDVVPTATASSPAWLQRIYGSAAGAPNDGLARVTLITCTGRWRGPAAGYDHRFIAFGELLP